MSVSGVHQSELYPATSRARSRLATAAILSLIAGGLGTSTAVAVAASPACSKLVHTYVDRVERNLVSAATLKRWHDWGVGHPNWRPNPLAHRPKFRKVREGAVSTLAIACPFIPAQAAEIALLQPDFDTFLVPDAPRDYSGDTLTPQIAAPVPNYASIAPGGYPGGYPGAAFGPIFPGGIAAAPGVATPGATTPGATTPTTPTTGVTTPPVSGVPVNTPVSTAPVTTPVTIPVTIPVPITPVTPAPVPEPGSIVLTLTGLSGIFGLLYSRRRYLQVGDQS